MDMSECDYCGFRFQPIIQLNDQWRVEHDEMQWVLQCRQGGRWRDRSFCVTREALLRCIGEHCGTADISAVLRLPDWHPDRMTQEELSRLLPASKPAVVA
jgi:hypothetical protein